MSPYRILLLVAFSVAAVAADGDHVVVLTEENFDTTIKSNPNVLVKFYAPWCGHCKSLAPKYEEAAEILAGEDATVMLAKVDATEHPSLSSRFDVRGYPTLLFFKNGAATKYTGGRDTKQIVDWLKKKTGPAVNVIESQSDLDDILSKHSVIAIGNFKNQEDFAATAFHTLADTVEDIAFAVDKAGVTAERFELVDGIALVRVEEGKTSHNTIEASAINDAEQLKTWLHAYKLAAVTEFNTDNAQDIIGGEIKNFHFLLIGKSHADFDSVLAQFTETAEKFRGKIIFVLLDVDISENDRIMDFLGVKASQTPTSRIVNLNEDVEKFKPKAEDTYESFSNDYLEGKADEDFKSEELPSDWNSKPVKYLVTSIFHREVNDESKVVFVKFYAPWCGHCKQLAPVWEELAEKFESNPNVVIAKMDSTLNEVSDVKVKSFPTLMLWPLGTNKKPVVYDQERTLAEFEKFVNAAVSQSETTSDEKESKEVHSEL